MERGKGMGWLARSGLLCHWAQSKARRRACCSWLARARSQSLRADSESSSLEMTRSRHAPISKNILCDWCHGLESAAGVFFVREANVIERAGVKRLCCFKGYTLSLARHIPV
eukprot:1156551-Pleurochrysis_carterae.AAC.3